MPVASDQILAVIIAVVLVLLFLGILFLSMLIYYKNKRKQMHQEKQALMHQYEKQILQSRIEMQEQTFTYISEEIHDNVGQSLSLAKIQLSVLEESNTFDKLLIREAKNNISHSLTELRTMAHSLNGERIKSFNLCDTIDEEAARLNRTGLYKVTVAQEGNPETIPDDHRLMLFRVIQEGLQNIAKHAGATCIDIRIEKDERECRITIADNGRGFTQNEGGVEEKGIGLMSMKKRVELMGGSFQIKSEPGVGTRISIHIHYD